MTVIDLSTPKDMRDALEKIFRCQQANTATLININKTLDLLAIWMKVAEGINVGVDDRLLELERKAELIMKATRHYP